MRGRLIMRRRSLTAFLAGLSLCLPLALAPVPPAGADDIDIYLQSAQSGSEKPLVVLNLDLNLDATEIVCSNVLADPSTLAGEPLCELLQRVAVLPVLEDALGLGVGSLLDSLLGSTGLLSLVSDLGGITLSELAGELRGIIGEEGTGTDVALDQLDVARLMVHRLLHQLVGVRIAIVANNASTCTPDQFTNPRHNTSGCSNGAFIILGATELLEDTIDATVDDILARLPDPDLNLDNPDADMTPPFQGKEMYYELIRYLTDGRIYNSRINDDNGLPIEQDPNVHPGKQGVDYISPLGAGFCDDIHVINVMFTDSQLDDDSDAEILADARFAGANADGGAFTWAEMLTHLETQGLTYGGRHFKVRNYFLLNGPGAGGPGALLSNLVGTAMDLPIGLNPLAMDYAGHEMFSPVLSESTSFGGPQTVFNRRDRGTPRDELYTGLFKPDTDRKPAWRGNLKKLEIGEAAGEPAVVDALSQPAIGPDGKIRDTALTHWTVAADLPGGDGVVLGRDGKTVDRGGAGMFLLPPHTPATPANPAAARGSGSLGPRIYYQTAPSGANDLAVADLNLNTVTVDEAQPALAAQDKLEAAELIAWARGYETDPNRLGDDGYGGLLGFLDAQVSGLTGLIEDLVEELFRSLFCDPILSLLGILLGYDCDVPAAVEPPERPWLMGDVLHSHPLAIDYGVAGDDDAADIRVFTGTNTGFLHQFRDVGGGSGTHAGQEVWRFSPRSVMDKYKLWRGTTPTAASRPYGVDGAPVAYIEDADGVIDAADGDKVHLYFGLRRGGKGYYGLDVSDPDAAPTGLWRIEKTGGSDFAELGLTFSTPRVGRIHLAGDDGGSDIRPVLIFGGGYDGGYDSSGQPLGKDAARGSRYDTSQSATSGTNTALVGSDDDEGNALFVVDAGTGALIWKARNGSTAGTGTSGGVPVWTHPDLDDGIASAPTALDTDGDGLIDRVYVGDTGGRVWRADIGNANPANWKMAPIADLGRHGTGGGATVADDRRFFHPPDVVHVAAGADSSFFAVIVASGNRADPLNRHTVNHLYVLKDGHVLDVDATPTRNGDLADFGSNCSGGTCVSLLDPGFSARGWRIRLPAAGEKGLAAPTTIAAKVLYTTYLPPDPAAAACEPQEGTGRLYAVDLRTGQPVIAAFAADGESTAGAGALDNARGTPLAAAGIPAEVHYLRPELFLGSDFGLVDVGHRQLWRTYWRERVGER